jgi:ADP-heptose:LPS heptosyltransferase
VRIAVLRALQVGDLLCAVPALRALRGAYPNAEITLIGLGWARDMVCRFPAYLDEFLELPGWPGLPEQACRIGEVPGFLQAAQGRGFDLAIQMHGSGEVTNPLVGLLGAARNAGFGLSLAYPSDLPEVLRCLALVESLGAPDLGTALEFPLRAEDRAHPLPLPYACLHPGARDPLRRWPPASFAAVGDTFAARGLHVVLTGSACERDLTQAVARAMTAPSIDLAGHTTLGSLAAVVEGASLVVTNDTSVSHLADALNRPSVVVFLASDPNRWAPLDSRMHRALVRPRVQDVLAAAAGLLTPSATTGRCAPLDLPLMRLTGRSRGRLESPLKANGRLNGVKKIAVLRANALGDFIFALPAFQALREAYPRAEIVLLGRRWHAEFLDGRPGPIDRVLVMPEGAIGDQAGVSVNRAEVEAFLLMVQQEAFDLAVQIHGGGKNSNPFLLRCGARLTIGLRTPDAVALDRWVPYLYFQPETLRYLEVVALVGAVTSAIEPRLPTTDADLTESGRVVAHTPRPLAVLHPGASATARRWPAERFARVGDALAERGCHVVLTGVPDEQDTVDQVLHGMRHPAQDACGRLTLHGLTGLLARAAILVSNDTGPLHVGMALGTPTVGIYWCGNLVNAGPFSRTWNRPVVSWRVTCPGCGVNTLAEKCPHGHPPVDDVGVEEVLGHALDLLARRATAVAA